MNAALWAWGYLMKISWSINDSPVSILCRCHFAKLRDNLISPLIRAWRVGFLFCWRTPVEDHMMLLCCFVMFCIWLRGEDPNPELNGVFVQHGSSQRRARVHTAASNKAVKMSAEAPRQHTPPGSCCLPGAHLQIIYCGRRCQSVLSGYTVFIKTWLKALKPLQQELGNNKVLII